jgi:hypothetical protein
MNNYWKKWTRIVKAVVNIQASVVLFLIYYIFVLPIGLYLKMFSRKSLIGSLGREKENSYWIIREKAKIGLLWAKAQ